MTISALRSPFKDPTILKDVNNVLKDLTTHARLRKTHAWWTLRKVHLVQVSPIVL